MTAMNCLRYGLPMTEKGGRFECSCGFFAVMFDLNPDNWLTLEDLEKEGEISKPFFRRPGNNC